MTEEPIIPRVSLQTKVGVRFLMCEASGWFVPGSEAERGFADIAHDDRRT